MAWLILLAGPVPSWQAAAGSPAPSLQTGYWLDPTGQVDLEAALRAVYAPVEHPRFGRQRGALWVRLSVDNPGPPAQRILRVGPALLEQVDLWMPQDGTLALRAGGLRTPMAERAVPDRQTVFPVLLPTGHSEFYLRIASPSVLAPILDLWQTHDWAWRARLADLGNAAMSGALLMIVVITLFYAVWTREWFWLFYAAGICSYSLFEACDDGFAGLWLWPERPALSLAVLPAALALDLSMYSVFFLRFIPLDKLHRGWRLLWVLPVAAGLGLILVYGVDYRVGMPVLNSLVVAAGVALPLLSVAAWRRGFRAGRWAPLGFGLVLAAILHRLGVGQAWWTDMPYADLWLLPLSGVLGTGLLLLAQMDQLRDFRAAQRRYLEQIATARDEADYANRAKSLLLARVSHDLRTPLHTLTGYVDLVRRAGNSGNATPDPVNRYLDAIHGSGRAMLALIDELLEFARGEEGRLELHARPTYLHALIQDIAAQAETLARQQGNRFLLDVDLAAPIAVIDGERLHSILMNLLSNACRLTVQGIVTLSATGLAEGPRTRLRFEVSDTGPGIAPEDRERIFLPFEYGGSTPTSSGLGLAIVRQLVKLMGADLRLESVPGRGATFSVELVARVGDEAETLPPATSDAPNGYDGAVRTLMSVDSVAENLHFMQDLLTGMGFDVIAAASAGEALALAAGARPDAAVVEQFLEDGDGWHLLDALKTRWPGLPVILLSATPARPPVNRRSAWSFDAELLKPLKTHALVEALGRCLSLAWRYESLPDRAPAASLEAPPGPARAADLQTLRKAAYEGSFFEVEEWIERWRVRPEEGAFLGELEPLVVSGKWPAIVSLVDRRLAEGPWARPAGATDRT